MDMTFGIRNFLPWEIIWTDDPRTVLAEDTKRFFEQTRMIGGLSAEKPWQLGRVLSKGWGNLVEYRHSKHAQVVLRVSALDDQPVFASVHAQRAQMHQWLLELLEQERAQTSLKTGVLRRLHPMLAPGMFGRLDFVGTEDLACRKMFVSRMQSGIDGKCRKTWFVVDDFERGCIEEISYEAPRCASGPSVVGTRLPV